MVGKKSNSKNALKEENKDEGDKRERDDDDWSKI